MENMLPVVAQPFVKWAGGKRRLLPEIRKVAPDSFDRYLEPFVGGGAVAFAFNYHPMLLNDANAELINTYEVVRDQLADLVTLLDAHRMAHCEAYFYEVRKQNPNDLSTVEQAARFIYLNKTAFNGLYRVNRFGQFNVPFGRYKNPILYDLDNLTAVSSILQSAELFSLDYSAFLGQHAKPGDFIYLDPPYQPIGRYSDFKRYTKNQFREGDQSELAQVFNELIKLGAYPVLSNSYSELTLELYSEHNIQIVEAPRAINNNGSGRGPVREILVTPRR
jgi:DNA adenine methylase